MGAFLKDNYGGKKAFLTYWFYKGLYLFKKDTFKVNSSKVKRLVFICTGNICRSPYAAQYAQGLHLNSISFGLEVTRPILAYPTALEVAKKRGVDLSNHLATSIAEYQYEPLDLIIVFEPKQLQQLRQLRPDLKAPIILLGQYNPLTKAPYIHDPYGCDECYFESCYAVIEQSIQHLQKLIGTPADEK
jgi:protein-tyrosine phosphatase